LLAWIEWIMAIREPDVLQEPYQYKKAKQNQVLTPPHHSRHPRPVNQRTGKCATCCAVLCNKLPSGLEAQGTRALHTLPTTLSTSRCAIIGAAAKEVQPARRISKPPMTSRIRMGSSTAIRGENPNTRLEGPSRSCTMRKLNPTNTPVN